MLILLHQSIRFIEKGNVTKYTLPLSVRWKMPGRLSVTDCYLFFVKGIFFFKTTSSFLYLFVDYLGFFSHMRKSSMSSRERNGNSRGRYILHDFPFRVLTLHVVFLHCTKSFYKICHSWFMQLCKDFTRFCTNSY